MKNNNLSVVGLIPSRLESTRLPHKALLDIHGMPMIVHVALRAKLASKLDQVYVCTDNNQIAEICIDNKIKVVLTRSNHRNGTERIAEAAKTLNLMDNQIVIDIQGDEPLLLPEMVDNMVKFMTRSNYSISVPYINIEEKCSPSRVKIVESNGRIIYLTRSDAPHPFSKVSQMKKHLSVIGFRVSALMKFASLEPTPLEKIEGVELLRAIENGIDIGTYEEYGDTLAVDTIEDYDKVKILMSHDKVFGKY
jgi:3-deoxy-manno-octulosonate cytidylyltransferase (CMP-KDO synthetase)